MGEASSNDQTGQDEVDKMKAGRFSPVLYTGEMKLNFSTSESSFSTPKSKKHTVKDEYAIETTSSPELAFNSFPSVQKNRKIRIPSAKSRASSSKRLPPCSMTPLSGLISRKRVGRVSKMLTDIEKDDDGPSDDVLSSDGPSKEMPHIETFDSPEKPRPSLIPLGNFDPKLPFPMKPSSVGSPRIITVSKKSSNPNVTLERLIIDRTVEGSSQGPPCSGAVPKTKVMFDSPKFPQQIVCHVVQGERPKLLQEDNMGNLFSVLENDEVHRTTMLSKPEKPLESVETKTERTKLLFPWKQSRVGSPHIITVSEKSSNPNPTLENSIDRTVEDSPQVAFCSAKSPQFLQQKLSDLQEKRPKLFVENDASDSVSIMENVEVHHGTAQNDSNSWKPSELKESETEGSKLLFPAKPLSLKSPRVVTVPTHKPSNRNATLEKSVIDRTVEHGSHVSAVSLAKFAVGDHSALFGEGVISGSAHSEKMVENVEVHRGSTLSGFEYGQPPELMEGIELPENASTMENSIDRIVEDDCQVAAVSLSKSDFESPKCFQQKCNHSASFGEDGVLGSGHSVKIVEDVEAYRETAESHFQSEKPVELVLRRATQDVDDDVCGFSTCTILASEHDSPEVERGDLDINPLIEEAIESDEPKVLGTFKIVVSDDSSASDEEFAFPVIEDPPADDRLAIVATKGIEWQESPSKRNDPFSEALPIGEFGSPEICNAENDEQSICVTRTAAVADEFIDDSEPVQPNKRKKKGSLMEIVSAAISRVEASRSLFEYEMKNGLRPIKGKFVSTPLVVCRKWKSNGVSKFILCKPSKYCNGEFEGVRGLLIALVVLRADELSRGDVISVHFPFMIAFNSVQKIPYAFIGNQITVRDEPKAEGRFLNVDVKLECQLTDRYLFNPVCDVKHFSSNVVSSVSEVALCQNLLDDVVLTLKVLHVVKMERSSSGHIMAVFCSDDDGLLSWVHLTGQRDMKRAAALVSLHVLAEGANVQLEGFIVTERFLLDKKTRRLAEYCGAVVVKDRPESIFTLSPVLAGWIVSSAGGTRENKKRTTLISDILSSDVNGQRYLIEVTNVEFDEQNVFLKDASKARIQFIQGENSFKTQLNRSSVPFCLDALYYYQGKVFSDEFTKLS